MNFLAHLHLAHISNTNMAANLAGDFSKGLISNHPKNLQQGIWLHRKIDVFTDTHEINRQLIAQFPKSLRRVAPILVDLAFDHMLAKYWPEYHDKQLQDFCDLAYRQLEDCQQLPLKLQTIAQHMSQDNWLPSFARRSGLSQAIQRVSKRLSKPSLFDGGCEIVEKMDSEIEMAFRLFYPQLMAYSRISSRKTPESYL